MRALRIVPIVVVLAGAACTSSDKQPVREAKLGEGGREIVLAAALQPFDACGELLDYVHREAGRLAGPYGLAGAERYGYGGGFDFGGRQTIPDEMAAESAGGATAGAPAPPVAGVDYSETNVQEPGVDEPDIVKTDGRLVVTASYGRVRVVDVSGDQPVLKATYPLPETGGEPQLLLAGDRLLVLTATGSTAIPLDARTAMHVRGPEQATTTVTVVDLSDPATPETLTTTHLEGTYVAARLVDGAARIVVRSQPILRGFTLPADESAESKEAAAANNRAVVERSTLEDWQPSFAMLDASGQLAAAGPLASCEEMYRPGEFSGAGTVSVVTVDPRHPEPVGAASVIGGGDLVYATAARLYVTTSEWGDRLALMEGRVPTGEVVTRIHAFDISDPQAARYQASGQVRGSLLSQFSLSEHEGHLRVASTDGNPWMGENGPQSESYVTVLTEREGTLAQVGQVGGLGKGERIYAVRFLGPLGYVVTFRQVDPLYVVDLSDPAVPAVRGELKIPGYSAYLHPVGEGLLLGIGQAATEEGVVEGTQVSLFDVSDPARPARLAQAALGQGSSEAEYDHHAFLWWPATGRAVVPLQGYGDGSPASWFAGVVGFDVSKGGGVVEAGRLTHLRRPAPTLARLAPEEAEFQASVRRSLVVSDRLYTVSEKGVLASDLTSLADRGWLGF